MGRINDGHPTIITVDNVTMQLFSGYRLDQGDVPYSVQIIDSQSGDKPQFKFNLSQKGESGFVKDSMWSSALKPSLWVHMVELQLESVCEKITIPKKDFAVMTVEKNRLPQVFESAMELDPFLREYWFAKVKKQCKNLDTNFGHEYIKNAMHFFNQAIINNSGEFDKSEVVWVKSADLLDRLSVKSFIDLYPFCTYIACSEGSCHEKWWSIEYNHTTNALQGWNLAKNELLPFDTSNDEFVYEQIECIYAISIRNKDGKVMLQKDAHDVNQQDSDEDDWDARNDAHNDAHDAHNAHDAHDSDEDDWDAQQDVCDAHDARNDQKKHKKQAKPAKSTKPAKPAKPATKSTCDMCYRCCRAHFMQEQGEKTWEYGTTLASRSYLEREWKKAGNKEPFHDPKLTIEQQMPTLTQLLKWRDYFTEQHLRQWKEKQFDTSDTSEKDTLTHIRWWAAHKSGALFSEYREGWKPFIEFEGDVYYGVLPIGLFSGSTFSDNDPKGLIGYIYEWMNGPNTRAAQNGLQKQQWHILDEKVNLFSLVDDRFHEDMMNTICHQGGRRAYLDGRSTFELPYGAITRSATRQITLFCTLRAVHKVLQLDPSCAKHPALDSSRNSLQEIEECLDPKTGCKDEDKYCYRKNVRHVLDQYLHAGRWQYVDFKFIKGCGWLTQHYTPLDRLDEITMDFIKSDKLKSGVYIMGGGAHFFTLHAVRSEEDKIERQVYIDDSSTPMQFEDLAERCCITFAYFIRVKRSKKRKKKHSSGAKRKASKKKATTTA